MHPEDPFVNQLKNHAGEDGVPAPGYQIASNNKPYQRKRKVVGTSAQQERRTPMQMAMNLLVYLSYINKLVVLFIIVVKPLVFVIVELVFGWKHKHRQSWICVVLGVRGVVVPRSDQKKF
ncbi:MAG: hypothetical protein ACOH2T_28675 [Pseudomonas sp.]